jgi:hypothetical protein
MTIDGAEEPHDTATVVDRAVIRESITMGLYITISLLAVLTAQPHGDATTAAVLTVVWGTTLGLTLAHWLAFRLTARLFAGAELPWQTGWRWSGRPSPRSALQPSPPYR